MTVWLLIIFLRSDGAALQTIQLTDQDSCERAGKRYVQSADVGGAGVYRPGYSCTQVKVPAK